MTAIDTAKTIINTRIASGEAGGVTAEDLRTALITLADAIVSDRTASNVSHAPTSPITGSDVGAQLDAVAALLDLKAPKASPALTGTPTAPTASTGVSSTQLATTAFAHAAAAAALASYAPLASPTFTGAPKAPNPSTSDNSTTIATTSFVQTNLAAVTAGEYRKNYVINPGMRQNQENPGSSGTASGFYPADQWQSNHVQDGTLTFEQVASATPGGSPNRIRMTVTSNDASLAAGQYALLQQFFEGNRTADLQWGTSDAVDVVVRFGFKGPAGTYAVALQNQDNNRAYVQEFTISGGESDTDTVQTLTFPGETSGTWDKDNTLSFRLRFVFACGSTFQTTAGAWQTGNFFGTSSTSNGIGVSSEVFEIYDVGLHADPNSLGAAPDFELPSFSEDFRDCQRFYAQMEAHARAYASAGSQNLAYGLVWPQAMRAAPTASISGGTTSNVSANIVTDVSATDASFQIESSASGDMFALNRLVTLNARM